MPSWLYPGSRCPWMNPLCSRLDLHRQSLSWVMQGCLLGGAFSFPQDFSCPELWILRLFAGDGSLGRSPGSSPAADHAKQLTCLGEGLASQHRGALGLK